MRRKRLQIIALGIVGLLAVGALSQPGRAALQRMVAAIRGHAKTESASPGTAAVTQPGPDLGERARARLGWNATVQNSVLQGTITTYNRDGAGVGTAALTIYRKYPNQLRVELNRNGQTEVMGFDRLIAWKSGVARLTEPEARDIRSWLRIGPERLFTTRGAGARYREAGMRREDVKAARPWQAAMRVQPPLLLQQVEMEDDIGLPPMANRIGDRRHIVYYLNQADFTIESARWLEPSDPTRLINDRTSPLEDVRVDFGDWRTVGAVQWPYDIVHWRGGKVDYRLTVSQMQVNQPLADTIFLR